jgi:hypothetical protein
LVRVPEDPPPLTPEFSRTLLAVLIELAQADRATRTSEQQNSKDAFSWE